MESLDGNAGGEPISASCPALELSRGPSWLTLLARFTSSRDVVESRCAVNKGDFCGFCLRGVASASDCPSVPGSWGSSSFFVSSSGVRGSWGASVNWGVVATDPLGGLSVNERVEALGGIESVRLLFEFGVSDES